MRGERSSKSANSPPRPGHPRACGENWSRRPAGGRTSTGHPRACGENSLPAVWASMPSTGHPRACGENAKIITAGTGDTGPSPRVRGERTDRDGCRFFLAGHPRACGENDRLAIHCALYMRAIPARAGRTALSQGRVPVASRAIPARAGRTKSVAAFRSRLAGHPRACGENLRPGAPTGPWLRAIPARAGRTSQSRPKPQAEPGPSPRVRGELLFLAHSASRRAGHPRACGENLEMLRDMISTSRAIPARAGRTGPAMTTCYGAGGPSPRVRGEQWSG